MGVLDRLATSRLFCAWRKVYLAILVILFVPLCLASPEMGLELLAYVFGLGIVPAAYFLRLRRTRPNSAGRLAFTHDMVILLGFGIGLIALNNYLGLVLLSPLAGFAVEGLVLAVLLAWARFSRGRRRKGI